MNTKLETLVPEWKKIHKMLSQTDIAEETDFQSFCWGWCVGKGLTIDQAYNFYQEMIKRDLF